VLGKIRQRLVVQLQPIVLVTTQKGSDYAN
jgi:hypothetical protein